MFILSVIYFIIPFICLFILLFRTVFLKVKNYDILSVCLIIVGFTFALQFVAIPVFYQNFETFMGETAKVVYKNVYAAVLPPLYFLSMGLIEINRRKSVENKQVSKL